MENNEQIQMLLLAYPWVITILAGLKLADLVLRPLCDIAQKYVDSTVDKADDEILIKVKKSKAFQMADYILGWAAGIKIPVKKEAVAVAPAKAE